MNGSSATFVLEALNHSYSFEIIYFKTRSQGFFYKEEPKPTYEP
jgi:hypothetical protein